MAVSNQQRRAASACAHWQERRAREGGAWLGRGGSPGTKVFGMFALGQKRNDGGTGESSAVAERPMREGLSSRTVWLVLCLVVGLGLRLGAWRLSSVWEIGPVNGLEAGYIFAAATIASGYGPAMASPVAPQGSAMEAMRAAQARALRISQSNPFPNSPDGPIPATLHPPGYSYLLSWLYRVGNLDGMWHSVVFLQVVADDLVCLLLFLTGRTLLSPRVGLIAAWVYALLPPAIGQVLVLLPDAWTRFFAAGILCLAGYAYHGRWWPVVMTGAVLGVACYFRSEVVLFPLALFVMFWIAGTRLLPALGHAAVVTGTMVFCLLPWGLFMQRVGGHFSVTSSGAGGSMYESLGEVPNNPWGVQLSDEWLTKDAIRRGFVNGAWTPRADEFYRRAWRQSIMQHPVTFARLVMLHRVPMALVPPYIVRRFPTQGFSFAKMRLEGGLSALQCVRRYPGTILANYWVEMFMATCSAVLLVGIVALAFQRRYSGRAVVWLLVPWIFSMGTMVVVKQIEPRNVSGVLVVQSLALAVALEGLYLRWWGRRTEAIAGGPLGRGSDFNEIGATSRKTRRTARMDRTVVE